MTIRDTPFAAGTPCWVDLATDDVAKSHAFYGGLFGWTFTEGSEEFGGYTNAMSDGHLVAGIMPKMGAEMPDVWSTYIQTDDLAKTFETATAAGATVIAPPMAVGSIGHMALMIDPGGAFVGLWQAESHTGFQKYNEPGSVTWDELHSKDFAATAKFYETVFGWTWDKSAGDSDEFRYFQGQVNGETVAGVMDAKTFLPAEVPSHWAIYFAVADVDASAALVPGLGGTITLPPTNMPFGRVAELTDATGAALKLHGPVTTE